MDFRNVAQKVTSSSFIIQGRKKISNDEIIRKYPDGVTITGFDIINSKDRRTKEPTTFAAFRFKEDDSSYFNGASLLNKIAYEWVNGFDGDCEKASEELLASGGVKIKMHESRTAEGDRFYQVEIM